MFSTASLDFPGGSMVKNPSANAGDTGSIPGPGRSPRERNGNPLQFLPGESYGQRSLVGYSPRGNKESDTTKQLTLSLYRVMSAHPLTMGDNITKVRIIIGKAQDY